MRKITLFIAALCAVSAMATEGALSGMFSISADKQVVFSQGNLQATTTDLGENWTWSFAENQWDIIGNTVANTAINGNGTVSENGTVDLFCWSTAATYFGIHNSTNAGDYSGDFVDWGTNPISNGGNAANLWRTLTVDEWCYLLFTRTDGPNLYGQATVNEVHGCILLPDNWTIPTGLSFQPRANNWTSNTYTLAQWSQMETAGAVFLPVAGIRDGAEVMEASTGFYWTATPFIDNLPRSVVIVENNVNCGGNSCYRNTGPSVRLVRDVKEEITTVSVTVQFPKAGENREQLIATPAEGAHYTFVEGYIYNQDNSYPFGAQALEANTDYSAQIKLVPEDGYEFAPGIAISANDSPANGMLKNTGEELIFYVLFNTGNATALDNSSVDTKATKRIVDGQLFIIRDGKIYNAQGVLMSE